MTSRDQLEELAKRLKWLNDHAPNYSPGLMSSWIDNVRPELEKAESAIRSLLAQEPVGTIGEENFTQHVMVGVNGWHTLPGLRSVPILFKVLPTSTPLYAAPVPAVEQGEVVVTWDEDHRRIVAVTRQNEDHEILSVIAEAAPLPAVDLEAFKAEAMRLADEYATEQWKEYGEPHAARAALQAHLDKLGGK
jgi:hypothetical protein